MKALVEANGRVAQVVPDADVFPVHESLQWVDADETITTQHRWDGAAFTPPVDESPTERERLDAMTASRFQAKAALDDAGLLDQVEAYMSGEGVPRRAKLAWQEASFRRGSNMVNQIGAELGLSQEDMDNLFIAAREIEA